MARSRSLIPQVWFGPERRVVGGMPLDPDELGESGWMILSERTWVSRVLIDPSRTTRQSPRSATTVRKMSAEVGDHGQLWTHIILLPTPTDADSLCATLLGRIVPNPTSAVTVTEERIIESIELRGTNGVRVLEQQTIGKGMTGRALTLVGAVDNVAFGMGYGCLRLGWSQDRFREVAQAQSDKIRGRLR